MRKGGKRKGERKDKTNKGWVDVKEGRKLGLTDEKSQFAKELEQINVNDPKSKKRFK